MLDGAVVVLDGNQGVEPQTETVWRQGDKYKVPRIIFANKMDKIGADFLHVRQRYQEAPRRTPDAAAIADRHRELSFQGVVDLIEMRAIVWQNEALGAKFDIAEIPDDLKEQAAKYRNALIEAAVELDDAAMEKYLDGEEPDVPTLKRLIRLAVLKGTWYPMLCGTAFKNKGVQPLLDAVVDYLPSPLDRPAIKGIDLTNGRRNWSVPPRTTEPMSLLAFKIMDDPFVGTITFCRVYSGVLNTGDNLLNSTRDKKERCGRMLRNARQRSQGH